MTKRIRERRLPLGAALLVSAVLALPAGAALAQPAPRDAGAARVAAAPTVVDQRLIDFELWRMTEDLQLSDEQAARVFPKARKLGEARAAARRERAGLVRDLNARLSAGDKQGAEELTGRIREHDAATERQLRSLENDVYSELTPQQQARYVIFREQFTRELHGLADEARRRGAADGQRSGRGRRR